MLFALKVLIRIFTSITNKLSLLYLTTRFTRNHYQVTTKRRKKEYNITRRTMHRIYKVRRINR